MNGELETGAYKPEAAGSREVIVDVCETALLAALIGVSGSFKIPRISTGDGVSIIGAYRRCHLRRLRF